ncbi:mercuric reductase [Mucilaginibacter sp. Bleaf8]|uniref:mercuric reductase n=1 Tax=Mucilaginibacter sp. Bleaf8 TaxID=2834430 RepID=UPI001BCDF579|nr:mercuric reductase [Mucilaginibacter sp. Bleaf8]MBS7564469.1 mercuric reductase [Mucilaginibacter sp. Bleaf8]
MKTYDVIIIGSGQAGNPLARKMAKAGKKVAMIEKRLVGGTCINDGCTPTKAMVASARAAYLAGRCNNLGVHIDGYRVDMPQIKKRRDAIVERSRSGNEKSLSEDPNIDLLMGEARFTGHKTVMVKLNAGGEEELTAEQVFIDAGTKPMIPEIEGLQEVGYLTSTTILDLEEVPEHILIIGGNYIALEFGQMFRRFGSQITMLERGERIMSHEDDDVAHELHNILEEEGIAIHSKAQAVAFKKDSNGKILATIDIDGRNDEITCSHVLVAAGRIPQTDALNLSATDVELNEKGYVKVDGKLQTNVPGIYALGDINGGPAFTHIAYNDFTIIYRNLIEGADLSTYDRPLPYCMFTDPQLGRVGLTEKQAREQGYNIEVAVLKMESVARAVEVGETRGLMKAVVNADTKEILGAAILGEEGGEIMSVLQMAMEGGITYDRIRYCVFAHPTYSESLNNLFMKLES